MLKSLFLLVFIALPAWLSAAEPDAVLASRLVGTWYSQFESKDTDNPDYRVVSRGEDTYATDGSVQGTSISRRGQFEDRMEYTGRWSVSGGYLVVEVTGSSGGYVSTETVTRDRIVKLDDSVLVLEAADGVIIELQRGPPGRIR